MWTGGTGEGDSKPSFNIFTGEPIPCRCSRLICAGFHACTHINPELLHIEHFELDPGSLEEIMQAQIQSHVSEVDSMEKLAFMCVFLHLSIMSLTWFAYRFWSVIHSKPCNTRDNDGAPCKGSPMMKSSRLTVHPDICIQCLRCVLIW